MSSYRTGNYGLIVGAYHSMGGYRPDTHTATSQKSKDEDQQRAEEKRMRRRLKKQKQIKD